MRKKSEAGERQTILQSYNYQNRIVLAEKYTHICVHMHMYPFIVKFFARILSLPTDILALDYKSLIGDTAHLY